MKSLKKNILFSIVLLTVFGDTILFYNSIHDSRITLRKVTLADMVTTARSVGSAVNIQLTEKFDFLHNLTYLPAIQDSNMSLEDKQDELNSILNRQKKSSAMIGLNISNNNGDIISPDGETLSVKNNSFYIQSINGKDWTHGPNINSVNGISTIYLSVPVFYSNNDIKHILFEEFDANFLCDIAKNLTIGETGYTIIIDRATGNTIGSPNIDDVLEEQNLALYAKANEYEDMFEIFKDCLSANEGSGFYDIDGKRNLIAYSPIRGTNWTAVVIADNQEFIDKLHQMENSLFVISALIIVAGIIIGLIISRSLNPLAKVGSAINEIASGNADLTQRLEIKKPKKEIADVVNGFNAFVSKLQEIVTSLKCSEENLNDVDDKLQESTQDSVSSITQIIANIQNVNKQISHQSDSVTETASAVNEISSNIQSLERMIENQSYGVSQASSTVEQMVGNINSVNTSVEKMVSSFSELEQNADIGIRTQNDVNAIIHQIVEQSKTLQAANAAISKIASQTNLLAMNAAIEAAHAGEAGKGFSVVSDEIRKLSETSSRESQTIGDELLKIQSSIENVVDVSGKATNAFKSVSINLHNTDQILQQIKGAMEEQQIGSQQIISALHTMNDSTLEVKSASAEMGEGNKLILTQVQNLQSVTDVINGSISEMLTGAEKIHETGATLSDISSEVNSSIRQIGIQINEFKV